MSNIPHARWLRSEARALRAEAYAKLHEADEKDAEADRYLTRKRPGRRIVGTGREWIGENAKAEVIKLAKTTALTQSQIAKRVGIRNQGRVSEILNGLR